MKALSLFSGIGAFEMGLKRAGYDIELVNFCEIDKYAAQSYSAVHGEPSSKNLKDVTQVKFNKHIDILTHGSPCQDFSVAGKGAGGEEGSGTRSSLLWHSVRIIKESSPSVVMWENVKNVISAKHRETFDAYLKALEDLGYNNYYKVLNAKHYGIPQNRERVFCVSIRREFDIYYPSNPLTWPSYDGPFPWPKMFDNGVRLKHLLEDVVDEKYYLSEEKTEKLVMQLKDKKEIAIREATQQGYALAKPYDGINIGMPNSETRRGRVGVGVSAHTLQTSCDQGVVEPNEIKRYDLAQTVILRKHEVDINSLQTLLREAKKERGMSNSTIALLVGLPVTNVEHWFRTDKSFSIPDAEVWGDLKAVLGITTDEFDQSIMTFEEKEGVFEKSNRVYCPTGIAPALTVASADEKILEPKTVQVAQIYGTDVEPNPSGGRVYDSAGLMRTLGSGNGMSQPFAMHNFRIRKLTPLECWRLMGFRDEDFHKAKASGISDSQLYKQAGNSIVVDVIEQIALSMADVFAAIEL